MRLRAQNSWMGFEDEVFGKYSSDVAVGRARTLYNLFETCFDHLSLATIINEKVFVCHGGLFHVDGVKIEHLDAIRRKREPPLGGKSWRIDCLRTYFGVILGQVQRIQRRLLVALAQLVALVLNLVLTLLKNFAQKMGLL